MLRPLGCVARISDYITLESEMEKLWSTVWGTCASIYTKLHICSTRDEARKKYDWGQLYNIFVTLGSFFINRPKLAMISERFATFHWGQLTPMRMRQLRPCVQQFCIFSSLEVKQAHLVCRSEIC
jgi:hypothetical protein